MSSAENPFHGDQIVRFSKIVHSLWRKVRRKREDDEFDYIAQNLERRVDSAINGSMPNLGKSNYFQRQTLLPTIPAVSNTARSTSQDYSKKPPKVQRVQLVGAPEPVPPHTGRLLLKESYPVSDSRELAFVPSAFADSEESMKPKGDSSTTPMEEYFAMFDVGAREKAIADGPPYHVKETNDDIAETIRRCLNNKVYQEEVLQGTINQELVADCLVTELAKLALVVEDRIKEIYEEVKEDTHKDMPRDVSRSGDSEGKTMASEGQHANTNSSPQSPSRRKNEGNIQSGDNLNSPSPRRKNSINSQSRKSGTAVSPPPYKGVFCQPVIEAPDQLPKPLNILAEDDPEYLQLVDSYRKLYCNRCKIYDCNVHGLYEKPSLQLSYELGITAERDRKMRQRTSVTSEESSPDDSNHSSEQQEPDQEVTPGDNKETLTDFQKRICRRFFLIFEGNIGEMATAMRANPKAVKQFVDEQEWTEPELRLVPPIKPEVNPYHSLRNYNQHWYSRIVKSGLRPSFEPCVHDEPCREGICYCVDRGVFCTDACAWGTRSKNFFRGCDCRGSCTTSSCSCFANSRECSPDICGCDACTDPPGRPATQQRCRNDNLTMHRGTEVVIGHSEIPNAGWGCFAKRDLVKGEFLGEYVGEMISQEEADRRGQLYDIRNHSSLFMLTADVALDADRKGNVMRYINHSSTPNTTPRTITVNGDNRIGFFALQDIEAQTELTFNYGYNFSVNNDFVLKAAKAVPWMDLPASHSLDGNIGKTNSRKLKKPQSKRKSSKPAARLSSSMESTDGPMDIVGDIDATGDGGDSVTEKKPSGQV